jgi:glycosyltransferase involved in cell wall biosynthesis
LQLLARQCGSERGGEPGSKPPRRIHRLDYVSRSNLVTLIRGARAVVFPSLYEGFGLPVLEAMTLGTPVVASRESSLPEIAGDAALLVDPYNTDHIAKAITTIANDADLRAELSRRGPAQAVKFSVDRYRDRVGAVYAALR